MVISLMILLAGAVATGTTMALRHRARRRAESLQDRYKRAMKDLHGGGIHPGGQDVNPNDTGPVLRGCGGGSGAGGGWTG
jgi:hypothetical protein